MNRLLVMLMVAGILAACNGNDHDRTSVNSKTTSVVTTDPLPAQVVTADALGDLSFAAAQALELPPNDGKLPVDLLPPQ